MNNFTIIGPKFSTFVKTIQLVCQYKGLDHILSVEHDGKPSNIGDDHLGDLHPYKKVPVLIHNDLILPEAVAIARYLDHFDGPSVFSADHKESAVIDSWASMLSIYVSRAILYNYVLEFKFPTGENGQLNEARLEKAKPAVFEQFSKLEQLLANNNTNSEFLVSKSFSYADAVLLPMLYYHVGLPEQWNVIKEFKNLADYYTKMSNKPYCKGVLQLS